MRLVPTEPSANVGAEDVGDRDEHARAQAL